VPSVIVDEGAITDIGIGTIVLTPGETYNTEKTLSGITSGKHTVCPNPN
jgi:predicted ribosome-associated RNA-binding protein Tma20